MIGFVATANNAEEEKRRNHKSIRDTRNYVKSGKITESQTKSLFIREIIGEKKRILTAALYNDTHNSIIC